MCRYVILVLVLLFDLAHAQPRPKVAEVDVCVYGGAAADVMAAYAATKLNKKVILIEPGFRLGGQSGQKPQEDFLRVYKEFFHSFKLYSTKI